MPDSMYQYLVSCPATVNQCSSCNTLPANFCVTDLRCRFTKMIIKDIYIISYIYCDSGLLVSY